MQIFKDQTQLAAYVIVIPVVVKIIVLQELFYSGKISRFGNYYKLLHHHGVQVTVNHFETQKGICGRRKEIIVDQQAVEVVEPAFIKNTRVSFDDVRAVKPIDFLLRTFTNEITFADCRRVDKILLPGEH